MSSSERAKCHDELSSFEKLDRLPHSWSDFVSSLQSHSGVSENEPFVLAKFLHLCSLEQDFVTISDQRRSTCIRDLVKDYNGDIFVLMLSLLNFPSARSIYLRIPSQEQVELRTD